MLLEKTKKNIDFYVKHGTRPGIFLYAVLMNSLLDAFRTADEDNRKHLFDTYSYIYNKIPASCYGSRAKVEAWIEMKAAERSRNKQR